MADAIRHHPWATTPLGPIETWSPTLLITLNALLASPTPTQLLWGPDRLVFYNDALVPMLMDKHPHALGRPGAEVWEETWAVVQTQIDQVFATGASFSYRDTPLLIRQNGILQQTFWTFSYSPVYDPGGHVAGLLNLTQDTTGAHLAHTALLASEQRFRLLVDKASVGIAIGDTQGKLTYLNPTLLNMLGYTPEDLASGRIRWDQLTPKRYAELDQRAIQQLQTTGVAEPYEKAYCAKSGELIPLLIGAAVIPKGEEYGHDSDIAVFAVDLRLQKRAEFALVQAEKLAAVGKLASSISHEINNPLEAVTNLLYIVRQDPNLSQSSRDFLQTADRELARVSQVTSQTLRFHRQSTAPMRIHPDALIEEVLQLYSNRLANAGIKVHRRYAPNTELTCYEGDIRQVLNNLVGNALDAMKHGGALHVRTRYATRFSTTQPGVLLTIADTGSGIPPDAQRRIFDAFFTTKGIHGTGLGLWISSRIVHKHRGFLQPYSASAPTPHGTVFHLWLPVELADSAGDAWHLENGAPA